MQPIFNSFFSGSLRLTVLLLLFLFCNSRQAQAQKTDSSTTKNASYEHLELDEKPEFPGGINALMAYLGNNVIVPSHLKRAGLEGLAVASFIINKKGRIVSVEIKESLHPDLDRELVKVIQNMPHWKPARNKGKRVAVRFSVPFRVKIT
ncbi:energy transducer TonB [Rufibacter roseolus]|uniref:energy transducer TonB n=1 Tax=Rufibacter roseolus TaxID=2817375 RepID=UPI001B30AEF3|nr:energy transducer TonB [Rufibacter roseolus]